MLNAYRLSTAILLWATAVGFASPAAAAEFLGVYRFHSNSGVTSTWLVTPCGPGCVDVGVVNISSSMNRFTGTAELVGGRWNMTVDLPDALRCELNQMVVPARVEFSWDAVTQHGTTTATQTTPNCGRPGGARMAPEPFRLTVGDDKTP